MYFQALVYFGVYLGRAVYFEPPNSAKQYPNLFCCLVGDTAHGLKGASHAMVKMLFEEFDPAFMASNTAGGMASGEGVIYRIRDGREDAEGVQIDPGVDDKRLAVIEGEFSKVLAVAGREGNTTSQIIRNAWDGERLENLTKNSPDKATDPHIGIIGHITPEELANLSKERDFYSGFFNRFLWLHSYRHQVTKRKQPRVH